MKLKPANFHDAALQEFWDAEMAKDQERKAEKTYWKLPLFMAVASFLTVLAYVVFAPWGMDGQTVKFLFVGLLMSAFLFILTFFVINDRR